MMRNLAAVGLAATMFAAPASASFVTLKAYSDDKCTKARPNGFIAVDPSGLANLVSAGASNDAMCFGPDADTQISIQETAEKCFATVWKTECGGEKTYGPDELKQGCIPLPDEKTFVEIGCVSSAPAGATDYSAESAAAQANRITDLTKPPPTKKVTGGLTLSSEADAADIDMEALARVIAEAAGVDADKVNAIISNLPLNRRLLADELYVVYTIEVANDKEAGNLNDAINDNPAMVADVVTQGLNDAGIEVDGVVVEAAVITKGVCGNICNEDDTYRSDISEEFWVNAQMGVGATPTKLGDALFGVPRLVPTNNFEEYEGSFDITNMDYLGSCAFMGVAGYILAILMLVLVVLNLVWHIIRPFCCCCKNKKKSVPKELKGWHKYAPMFFMLLWTVLASIGCFLIYGGAPKLMGGVSALIDVIENEVDVLDSHANVIDAAFKQAAAALPDQLGFLENKGEPMIDAIAQVDEAIAKNKDDINAYIKQANFVFVILACVFLAVALVTTIAGECGWLFLLHIFKHIAHLLTVVAWLIFGISMTVAVVMDDLCTSMENYLEDPSSSSLDSLMPCLDAKTAVETMNTSREGITDAMIEIQGPGTGFGSIVAMNNRLYGNMVPLCEPFTLIDTSSVCAGDTTKFRTYEENLCKALFDNSISGGDLAYVQSPCDECCTPLFKFESAYGNIGVPEDTFQLAVDGVSAIDALRVAQPPIEALLNCDFVTSSFRSMTDGDTCKGLNGGLQLFYVGMALVSVGYTFLWITWNVADHHIADAHKRKAALKEQKKLEMQAQVSKA